MNSPKSTRIAPVRKIAGNLFKTGHWTRLVVIVVGIGLLLWATWRYPPPVEGLFAGLALAVFAAFAVVFPLHLLEGEVTLVQIVAVGGGFLLGAATAGWIAVAGYLLGYAVRRSWRGKGALDALSPSTLPDLLYSIGLQNVCLITALAPFGWGWGLITRGGETGSIFAQAILALLTLSVIHAGLFFAEYYRRPIAARSTGWSRELLTLAILELMPVIFVAAAILGYPAAGAFTLLLLGGVPAVLAILLWGVNSTRLDLERRVQELSVLNQVSQVLRSSLEMKNLLAVLQRQVSQFLGVDSFYVALYDQESQRLWYPIAVKEGQFVTWEVRPLTDRLTDRVIRTGEPILLPKNAQNELARIGLPPSENAPEAWMGVPLITAERTIGCLGVVSFSAETEFTADDIAWLTILSGQASVALENALYYAQAQRRAAQLEVLNQVAATFTASLDPQTVIEQVSRAATEIVHAPYSALFLHNQAEGQMELAYACGLSEAFVEQNRTFSLAYNGRTRCLRTGQPELIPDLSSTQLNPGYLQSLQEEGIQALGDFPLVAPDSQIGYLTVFYDEAHAFTSEEVELLQTLAGQAALAVSNARLYRRTDLALTQRVNQLAILEAVGRELAAALRSDRLFEMILDYAMEFTRSHWGGLNLYDAGRGKLRVVAARGYRLEFSDFPPGKGITGRAALLGKTLNVANLEGDSDYLDFTDGRAHSQLSVPLIHEGRVLGVLTLESDRADAYGPLEQSFAEQLATQAALAVANAELFRAASHGRDRLAAVLDSVAEGFLMVDVNGRVELVNQAFGRMIGVEVEQITGVRLTDLPEQALGLLDITTEQAHALVVKLGQGQAPPRSKAQVVLREPGVERVLERSTFPVWDQAGKAIGWMVVLRDTTEEYQIAQARELITETLVHDLRSPVSAVLGALDVIGETLKSEGVMDRDLIAQGVKVARRGASRLLNLVETLLDIARLQAGKMETTLVTTSLSDLVNGVVDEFGSQAQEYGVILRNERMDDLPLVRADVNKIVRVVSNLVDNALKFTPSGGQVVITTEAQPDRMIALRVSDTGPGVPAEYRERIFERFVQVPGLRGRRRGTGLGLAFCRLAVEAHGGRIWVEPRAGGGSTFVFTLPALKT